MSTPTDFKTDPKRDATDSIRGYVYQIYQSVLAWMQLKDNEILVLEGAEDFDVHCGSSVTTTQVKDVSGNQTLRSAAIVDSINNYWIHCERNPDHLIILRYLTTAEAGCEQGAPFGTGQKGLEYWKSAESDDVDITPLRTFLPTLDLSANLVSFIRAATDDELRERLIRRIQWDMGEKPMDAIGYAIEDKLKVHGSKFGISPHYSRQALPHLVTKAANLLSTKGVKELRLGDFLSSFEEATTVVMPLGEMMAMSSGSKLQQLAGMAEMMRFTNRAPTIGKPLPIVDGCIARTNVVSNIAKLLREQRIIFLYGSSGLGKTNLAALLTQTVGGNWGWAGFRGRQADQIMDMLEHANFELNTLQLPPLLVLDDIDFSQADRFEREFITLVFSASSANGMVIVTSQARPPLQLLPKLWKSEICEVSVPYFDEAEVSEMVRNHGLVDDVRGPDWTRTILVTTSGHPQLVHARVRNLSKRGWPTIDISDLTKPEDIERVRAEARKRLVAEFPSENTRILAYRLSLIIGSFSRETAIAVAEAPPPTTLPGEAFDALIGPWIEREEDNRYRISPLLSGAATNVLSETEITSVHGGIALSIINRKSIDQFEVSTAFFHAFMAKHAMVLASLANKIITTNSEHMHFLYDAMSWYPHFSLEAGQKILPGNPAVDLMLRLAQYKLTTCSSRQDNALSIIERIEETINQIEPSELRQYSEGLAYGIILNNYEVQIPSSIVIRLLSRMIDLADENLFLKTLSDSFGDGQADHPRIGENKPEQLLFSYQGARLTGLDDLSELVTSLNDLPKNKRDHLLSVCNSDMGFAELLVNRAWWKEVKDGGTLDVEKALKVLDFTAIKSREWQVPKLLKACLVAMSVVHDEYGHSAQDALEILDAADKEFPEDASLINQRAKVLLHADRDLEALPLIRKALSLSGLSDVEFVYSCRNAGISAAKQNDWVEADRFFLMGAEKAKRSSVQQSMGIGLMADAAYTQWKQKKFKNSLLIFADVLDLLGSVPLTNDIRIHHLHATVRHSISWIHFDASGTCPTDFADPLPGMCSNQEPHKGIKDHRIVDIGAAWELLAATEHILELVIGIKERAQSVTGGKSSLLLAGYGRTLAFDSIFRSKDFGNLVPRLIEMLEGLLHSKKLKDGDEDVWAIGEISKLPEGHLENPENWVTIYHYILLASVICTAHNQTTPLPIECWRADLGKVCALPDSANQFFNVLNGENPNNSLYQQAAAAVFALRNGALAPTDLWKHSFRLLNAIMHEKRWVEAALEELLITRWVYATRNQRFAFSTPSLACPEIESCCLDQSLNGLAKIAAVLDIAAPYLNIRTPSDTKQMLKKIIEQGKLQP